MVTPDADINIQPPAGLPRKLGLSSATAVVIASMIGTGIFTTTGFILEELTNPMAVLLCWAVGGLFALSGALCYAELGAMFPHSGGEYVYLRESLGRPVAFLSGWISLIVGFSAPIAASAVAFSTYALGASGMTPDSGSTLALLGVQFATVSPTIGLAVIVIILMSLVHYRGLKIGVMVQNLLTAFKVLLLVGICVAGYVVGDGDITHLHGSLEFGEVFSRSFAVSLIFISFAYSGWNAATYLGGEVRQPARNLPRALVGGTVIVLLIYLMINAAYFYALPAQDITGVINVGAMATGALFGEASGRFISAGIAVCILSVVGAMILTGPRVYYAMGKDFLIFERFARLSPRFKTPGMSILLQAVLAIVMAVSATFEALLIYIGFTLSLVATLTVIGMMMLRVRHPTIDRPYRTWGYPMVPVLFIIGNLWIILVSVQSRPTASLFGLGTIAAGLLVYQFFKSSSRL